MTRNIFVNLPVQDLERSKAFFTALGFRINPQFTGETAACVVISDTIYAMLLVHAHFSQFTPKPIADATTSTEVLVALSCASADEVRSLCTTAFAHGARRIREPQDLGFMFQWAFEDLDGHIWELFWMDPAHLQREPG
jgi:predicted lactoylglutathione lyase